MKTSEAIANFGSRRKLAEALGIKTQAISQWGEYPPRGKQFEIEVKSSRPKLRVEPELRA